METSDRRESLLGSVRSLLFTPGDAPDRFEKGAAIGADVVIIDLEDAVAAGSKETARRNAIAHLRAERSGGPLRAVRINDPASPLGLRDLAALRSAGSRPDLLVVPKVENAETLLRVGAAVDEDGAHGPGILPLIESAAGALHAEEILAVDLAVGVLLGAADLAADLRIPDPDRASLAVPRMQVVMAAASRRKPVFDAPWFAFRDDAGLRADVASARAEGFSGKCAVHPAQVASINAAWTPTVDEIAHARRVIAAADRGVGEVDGQMVDEAMARRARDVVARSRQPRRG